MLSNILDRIAFWSIFVVIVLLPLFFLPFANIPIETSKGLLLVSGLVVSIIAWSAARFSDGKIVIPRSKILLAMGSFVVVVLLSAIFSATRNVAFFGIILDFGSFWFMLCAFLLALMSALVVNNDKKAKLIMKGLIVSSLVLIVFQITRFFIPNTLSLGFFEANTGNVFGSWNSLGLFAGLVAILSIFSFEFLRLNKQKKIAFSVLLAVSLFLVASVNFILVWQLLGLFALVIFVYKLASTTSEDTSQKKRFPGFSFGAIILSLLFVVSGQFIGGLLPNALGLYSVEVNPSFTATYDVAKSVFTNSPVLGMGPNTFNQAWDMYKPDVINASQFWNSPFVSGASTITTLMVNTGILGTLAILAFIVLLFWNGFKDLFAILKDKKNHEVLLYFIVTLYLFVSAIFYSVGATLFLLAFAFVGVFIGVSASHLEKNTTLSFLDDPRKSFFSILFLVVLMIATAGISFKYIERFASVPYFSKTLTATSLENAENSINKAVLLNSNDLYLRTYTQVYLSKIGDILSTNTELTEQQRATLQASIDNAVRGATGATLYNKNNYLNFDMLGFVYKNSASLGLEGASTLAITAYTEASRLNPKNPLPKLELARVYLLDKKVREARDFAIQAITLKPDFAQALIFLAQLEKDEGNNTLAVSYAEKALLIFPNDPDLVNYVKSLKTNTKTSSPVILEETQTNTEE